MDALRNAVWLAAACVLLGCGDKEPPSGMPEDPRDAGHEPDAHVPDASGMQEPDAMLPDMEDDAGFADEDAGAEDGGALDSAYYPLQDGASWVYRHTGGATQWDEEVALHATQHEGATAWLLTDSPSPSGKRSESVLARIGSRVSRVHRDEYVDDLLELSADYDPGFVRFDHAWTTRSVGDSEVIGYARVERDAQGTVTADGERAHRYTVESLSETITVPAGELHDCVRIRRTRERAPSGQAAGPLQEGDDDRFWFCPGVGKAREEDQVTLQKEELVRCAVPRGACPQ